MQTVAKFHVTTPTMKKKVADVVKQTEGTRASVARVQLMLDIAREMLNCLEHNPDYVLPNQKVALMVNSVTGPDYDTTHWTEDSKRFIDAVEKEGFQCRVGTLHAHAKCKEPRCVQAAFHFAW
jgi:hypothetical protein